MSFRGGSGDRGGGFRGGDRGGFRGGRGGFNNHNNNNNNFSENNFRGGAGRGGFVNNNNFRGGAGRGGSEGSFGRGRGFGSSDAGSRGGHFEQRGGFRGGRGGFSRGGFEGGSFHHNNNDNNQHPQHHHHSIPSFNKPPQDICIFLVNAGLYPGQDGLVDAYDRGLSTDVKNESVMSARPDIVHQCLLSIFDSELGASGRVRVFIYTTRGKTIEVSPHLRPPRTYDRFKGLIATVLRDGKVLPNEDAATSGGEHSHHFNSTTTGGAPLLQILQGSIAPMIPEGADVIGITNAKYANIATPLAVAQYCTKNPISQQLRGGRKGVSAFFCIDCRDEADPAEEPCVTKLVSLSPYPQAPHVQAIRLCEGFQFLNPTKYVTPKNDMGARRQREE